jgi:hypothetical protein
MMQLHQWTIFGSYFYQHLGVQNATDGLVTMRAYMMIAVDGKQQNTLNWINRKNKKNKTTTILHTRKTKIISGTTTPKDHLHHMIVTTIMINDLAMIVDAHHHKIAPTPKRAVCAELATTTDKVYRSMKTRKDTNNTHTHLGITNERSMNQQHMNHTLK